MNILIVAPFVSLPGEPYFNRFLYLARMWSDEFRVTLVTSSFCHATKSQRDRQDTNFAQLPFDLVLLDEPGYRKNVSVSRITSHHRFVVGFRKWLVSQMENWHFDVVYSAYPLIATNLVLADLKGRLEFKLVIDVQDVWPESISAAIPLLGRFEGLLWAFIRKADHAYGAADGLVAVSSTYLERARRKCKDKPGMVAYLGSDRGLVDSVPAAHRPAGGLRLLYLGTISYSYDMLTLVKGLKQLRQRHPDLQLHVLGDGPQGDTIQHQAGQGVVFYGLVPYEQMVAIAKSCDVAINPIVKSAAQSVTNKISDYFTLGLPIISSQLNPEVVELIRKSGGEQYEAGNVDSFCDAVERFIGRDDKDEVRSRTHQLGVELFDRAITYPKITSFVRSLCV